MFRILFLGYTFTNIWIPPAPRPCFLKAMKRLDCVRINIPWVFHCTVLSEKIGSISSARSFYDYNFLTDTYILMNILQCQGLNVIYITISLT